MHRVVLVFELNEEVTPELFASKIALACSKEGALREGESVISVVRTSNTFCNSYTHEGFIKSDYGGMLKKEITVPNIRSSIVEIVGGTN